MLNEQSCRTILFIHNLYMTLMWVKRLRLIWIRNKVPAYKTFKLAQKWKLSILVTNQWRSSLIQQNPLIINQCTCRYSFRYFLRWEVISGTFIGSVSYVPFIWKGEKIWTFSYSRSTFTLPLVKTYSRIMFDINPRPTSSSTSIYHKSILWYKFINLNRDFDANFPPRLGCS